MPRDARALRRPLLGRSDLVGGALGLVRQLTEELARLLDEPVLVIAPALQRLDDDRVLESHAGRVVGHRRALLEGALQIRRHDRRQIGLVERREPRLAPPPPSKPRHPTVPSTVRTILLCPMPWARAIRPRTPRGRPMREEVDRT